MLANKITPTPTNPDNNVYILNLSILHKLAPTATVLDNFSKLHYDYAKSWLHYEWYSKLWVKLHYLKMISPINDYKLGKINTDQFINRLQEIFHFLPPEESETLLKNAWNSLIVWDTQASQRLDYVIEKNQGVSLISNTNELNIQKIKRDFECATEKTWNWQKQSSGECHFQVYENFRLMTSYDNGVFKTEGLLEKLVAQLVSEGHQRESITLVSQYRADLDKAKTLGINSQKPNQFFSTHNPSAVKFPDIENQAIAIANNSDTRSRQGQTKLFFIKETNYNQEQESDSEKSPLLLSSKP